MKVLMKLNKNKQTNKVRSNTSVESYDTNLLKRLIIGRGESRI